MKTKGSRNASITMIITTVCLGIIALTTLLLSTVFIVNARNTMKSEVTVSTQETMLALRNQLLARFDQWNTLVTVTSVVVPHFIEETGVDVEELAPIMRRIMASQPDVTDVYLTSNVNWFEPGGFAIFAGGWEPPATWANSERPWFQAAKRARSGTVGYAEPFLNSETGSLSIALAINTYDDRGRDLGVVAADVDFNLFNGLIAEKIFMPDQKMFLINGQGRFITHDNPKSLLVNDFFNDFGLGHYRNNVLSGSSFSVIDRETYVQSIPIPGMDWYLVSTVPTSYVFASVNRFVMRMVIIATALFIVAAIVMLMLTRRKVAVPLKGITHALNDIANGEGDLTVHLPETGAREIADISTYFNQTIGKIRDLISEVKKRGETLSGIGGELTGNMEETASAMNQITANIQNIKGRIINQGASVSETHSTMEQISANIGKLNIHVERQTNAVSQSSSALEEVLANIQSVTTILTKNAANVQDLQKSSETGRISLHEVAQDIQEIARESEGLLEINSVMENIASQTNLLSMNAAIEAAHAGEAGRGFSVVAEEIRKLAESSGEQSKVIGNVLKKIKDCIEKISKSTDMVLRRFEAIDQGVKTVVEQEGIIRSAMEEQNQGSKQILQASAQVSEITQQVKGGTMEMLKGSREVISESKNLEQVTQEITNGMNEMAMGSDEVNIAVNNVNDLSNRTQENISFLMQAVSRFKV